MYLKSLKILTVYFLVFSASALAQYDGNTTPTYPELIKAYQNLANENKEIELYEMGQSDYGLPIYLCMINGAGDSTETMNKARTSTTILINNAIHPGEPDGVNACLIWINDWIKNGKDLKEMPVVAIIPAYNVGGMMNRSGTSRANQNGPEEYGFRGNAQNLDLNRDFIKMDSKNMYTFAKIYHALEPDVFLDTHVSNGADYQYTMTYIASVRERMAPAIGDLTHDDLIPFLSEFSTSKGFDLIPYVNLKEDVPEKGIVVFNDLPRYAMGYAALMNSISFTSETHMLKAFPQRVQATLTFIEGLVKWTSEHRSEIESARISAIKWEKNQAYYSYNYQVTDEMDSIRFKGFEYEYLKSPITERDRLKYFEDRPYDKMVPYYSHYQPGDSVRMPDYFVLGRQSKDVIDRLEANNIKMKKLESDTTLKLVRYQIRDFSTSKRPYEGHFLHSKIERIQDTATVELKAGDLLIPTRQKNRRFIMSVLEPSSPDSYFAWNYFDSYAQQKEHFSPYVFEDRALELLESDPELKAAFEKRRKLDREFGESSMDQLYFIYQRSEYFEPSFNILPVYGGFFDLH